MWVGALCHLHRAFWTYLSLKHTRTLDKGTLEPPLVETQHELPHRRYALQKMESLHARHKAEIPMYDAEKVGPNVPVTRIEFEKTSSASHSFWRRMMGTRIPGTQWTTGNALFCVLYVCSFSFLIYYSIYFIL